MTPVGQTCLTRAIIEFERRFLNSTLETRLALDSPHRVVEINERQLAATLIDLRTVKCQHLSTEQRKAAQIALCKRYVTFYVNFKKVQREKQARASAEAGMKDDAPSSSSSKEKSVNSMLTSGVTYAGAAEDVDASGFDFGDHDSDSDAEEDPQPKTESDLVAEDEEAAKVEFKRVFANWFKYNVDYAAEFPHAGLPKDGAFDLVTDLMHLDMGVLYRKIIARDTDRTQFGFLPLMAGCTDAQIGALNAESFAERIISASNTVMNEGNTLLNDGDLEKLVVLRMNREFMHHMRDHYFDEIKAQQPFNMSVVEPK